MSQEKLSYDRETVEVSNITQEPAEAETEQFSVPDLDLNNIIGLAPIERQLFTEDLAEHIKTLNNGDVEIGLAGLEQWVNDLSNQALTMDDEPSKMDLLEKAVGVSELIKTIQEKFEGRELKAFPDDEIVLTPQEFFKDNTPIGGYKSFVEGCINRVVGGKEIFEKKPWLRTLVKITIVGGVALLALASKYGGMNQAHAADSSSEHDSGDFGETVSEADEGAASEAPGAPAADGATEQETKTAERLAETIPYVTDVRERAEMAYNIQDLSEDLSDKSERWILHQEIIHYVLSSPKVKIDEQRHWAKIGDGIKLVYYEYEPNSGNTEFVVTDLDGREITYRFNVKESAHGRTIKKIGLEEGGEKEISAEGESVINEAELALEDESFKAMMGEYDQYMDKLISAFNKRDSSFYLEGVRFMMSPGEVDIIKMAMAEVIFHNVERHDLNNKQVKDLFKQVFDTVIGEKKEDENKKFFNQAFFTARDKVENLLAKYDIDMKEFPAYIDNAVVRGDKTEEFIRQIDQVEGEDEEDCLRNVIRASMLSDEHFMRAMIKTAQEKPTQAVVGREYIDKDTGYVKKYYSESERLHDTNRFNIVFKYDHREQVLTISMKDEAKNKIFKEINFEMDEYVRDIKREDQVAEE